MLDFGKMADYLRRKPAILNAISDDSGVAGTLDSMYREG